ncbi:MAG: response regulator transcription factor [Bacteroidetes bacterium]|jgi:two-component system LytT family response regulator|nr:response regulator transcription factor [Bacteroidota bacterium]MBK7039052.1 response regulator transcription factor [Bacteroidota bacterium]MBK8329380.1 response regulator transcription factor [Bacteroidota bacterium]MBK9300767.1 response regulator transcription factor [Bacteroidota bacterium]MBK9482378.1 response regulator transcription factor [Bacteroidota bacterium]
MIKAIIIDDEKNALEMMEWLLQTYCPDVEIKAMCQSGEDGLKAIELHQPDILFLDIEMPKMNGFDVLEKFQTKTFEVVFTTAYDKFAVRAFRHAALNYLLKPIDPEDLISTINRLKEKKASPNKDQMELLFQNLLNKGQQVDRIALSTNDGLIFVQTHEIMYCKAESNYTQVVLNNNKKILVAKTLKDIDDTLAGKDFFRVHNSYLVNINHISKFVRGDGGYILMPDNTEISISRSKRDDFFKLFAKF